MIQSYCGKSSNEEDWWYNIIFPNNSTYLERISLIGFAIHDVLDESYILLGNPNLNFEMIDNE